MYEQDWLFILLIWLINVHVWVCVWILKHFPGKQYWNMCIDPHTHKMCNVFMLFISPTRSNRLSSLFSRTHQ